MEAKLDCIRKKNSTDIDCNAVSHCSTATDDAVAEVVKGERCWTDGRLHCTLGIFKKGTSGDCYSTVACMCNKECINDCAKDKSNPFEKCSSMKCMCDMKLEDIKKLQESYFSEPLKLVDEKNDQTQFQKDLVDSRISENPTPAG